MLHPSLSEIASWPTPNYENPVMHDKGRISAFCILTVLVIVIVVLRFYSRLRLTKSFGTDDALIGAALVPTVAYNFCLLLVDIKFSGRVHLWDVPRSVGPDALKMFFAAQICYSFASPLTKISILCLYRRLLGASSDRRILKGLIVITGALILGLAISYFFTVVFECSPIKASLDFIPSYPYSCIHPWSMLVIGILGTINDFMVLALPIPIVWKLQLPIKQRIVIISIFSISFLACFSGIIRVVYSSHYVRSYDLPWDSYAMGLAAGVELNLGVICASAPALRPLFARYLPRVFESSLGPKPTPKYLRLEIPSQERELKAIA